MQGFPATPLPFKPTPIYLSVYLDPQCPYSKRAFASLEPVQAHYTDRLVIMYHFCALPIHYSAFLACQALRIIQKDHGTHKMFEYLRILFENQAMLQNANTASMTRHEVISMLGDFTTEIECDVEQFRSAMTNWNYTKLAMRDWQYAVSRGVSGTPKFFINDFAVVGLDSNSKLVDWRKRLDPLVAEMREEHGAVSDKSGEEEPR